MLVNGDLALAEEFDTGVHLRAAQLASLQARPWPRPRVVAASCHTLDDIRHAERLDCDFIVLGPVFETATHPGAAPIGWAGFTALREDTALPMYALGGLGAAQVEEARAHGAQGVAAIRALWPSD